MNVVRWQRGLESIPGSDTNVRETAGKERKTC